MRRAIDDEWFEPAEESARSSLLVDSLASLATRHVRGYGLACMCRVRERVRRRGRFRL